jgi:hypothetical protein
MNVWKIVVAAVLVSLLRSPQALPQQEPGKLLWSPDCHACSDILSLSESPGGGSFLVYVNPAHIRQWWTTTGNVYNSPGYVITTTYYEVIRKAPKVVASGEGVQWPEVVYNYQRIEVDLMPPARNGKIHWMVVRSGPEGWLVVLRVITARPVAVSNPTLIASR